MISKWYSESNISFDFEKVYSLEFIYLHGLAEKLANNDLLVGSSLDVKLGSYPVVIDINGITYGCQAYVWLTSDNIKKGLVVLNTDKEANQYAISKFNDQSICI